MSDSKTKFQELMEEQLPFFIDMRQLENQMLETFKKPNNMTKNEDVKPIISDDKPVEHGNLLIVDIAQSIYNKISGFFSYFRGVEKFKA